MMTLETLTQAFRDLEGEPLPGHPRPQYSDEELLETFLGCEQCTSGGLWGAPLLDYVLSFTTTWEDAQGILHEAHCCACDTWAPVEDLTARVQTLPADEPLDLRKHKALLAWSEEHTHIYR